MTQMIPQQLDNQSIEDINQSITGLHLLSSSAVVGHAMWSCSKELSQTSSIPWQTGWSTKKALLILSFKFLVATAVYRLLYCHTEGQPAPLSVTVRVMSVI